MDLQAEYFQLLQDYLREHLHLQSHPIYHVRLVMGYLVVMYHRLHHQ